MRCDQLQSKKEAKFLCICTATVSQKGEETSKDERPKTDDTSIAGKGKAEIISFDKSD